MAAKYDMFVNNARAGKLQPVGISAALRANVLRSRVAHSWEWVYQYGNVGGERVIYRFPLDLNGSVEKMDPANWQLVELLTFCGGLATNKIWKDTVSVGVHSGVFHADDALCVAMLWSVYGTERVTVVRSRDTNILADCDYVLDVGGQDMVTPERVCFDHHGGSAPATVRENGVKSAACGKLADWLFAGQPWLPRLHERLLDAVEAGDNGQDAAALGLRPSRLSFVNLFVPLWDEEKSMDAAFMEAVAMTKTIFERTLQGLLSEMAGQDAVCDAIASAQDGVMELPAFINGWVQAVVAHNNTAAPEDQIKMVLWPSDGQWVSRCAPVAATGFETVVSCPSNWRGKGGAALEAETGIPGSIFCHATGFMAAWQTRDAARAGAEAVLAADKRG